MKSVHMLILYFYNIEHIHTAKLGLSNFVNHWGSGSYQS